MKLDWENRSRQVRFEAKRLLKLGPRHITFVIFKKATSVVICITLAPLTVLLHLCGFRVVNIFTDRIGHLAIEPDCLIKDQRLGVVSQQRWILLAPPQRTANDHLLSYWENEFHIVRQPSLCFLLRSMTFLQVFCHDVGNYMRNIGHTQAAYRVQRNWADRPPVLSLSEDDQVWSEDQLRRLGIPEHAWFVCVHVREGGFSPIDEELHSHRNADIKNVTVAALEIVRMGGWVVRLGDPTMKPMQPLPHLIDYAHHPMKSARLDVILCARARFILGNTSGICLVGTVFGVPSALANMIPISAMGVGKRDLSIPKMHWSEARGRYLSLDEINSEGLTSAQYSEQFLNAGVRLDENSAIDILEMTQEMFKTLEEKHAPDSVTYKLQIRFIDKLTEGSYSYGTSSLPCAGFLIRHASALRL